MTMVIRMKKSLCTINGRLSQKSKTKQVKVRAFNWTGAGSLTRGSSSLKKKPCLAGGTPQSLLFFPSDLATYRLTTGTWLATLEVADAPLSATHFTLVTPAPNTELVPRHIDDAKDEM